MYNKNNTKKNTKNQINGWLCKIKYDVLMYLKFDYMHINSIKKNLFALGLLHLAKY